MLLWAISLIIKVYDKSFRFVRTLDMSQYMQINFSSTFIVNIVSLQSSKYVKTLASLIHFYKEILKFGPLRGGVTITSSNFKIFQLFIWLML